MQDRDRRVEEGLFHCGRLQSRGVKQENSADKPCFNVFYMFRWSNTVISGAGWAARTPRAGMNSKKNHVLNEKNELFNSQKSSNPSWRS